MLRLFLRRYDWFLLAAVIILTTLGIVMVYSTTGGAETYVQSDAIKQIIFAVVSLVVLLAVSFIDYRIFRNVAWPLYGGLLVALVAVLLFAPNIRGAVSWFTIGPVNVQPGEFAKIILVIVLARFFSGRIKSQKSWWDIILSGLVVMVPVGFILLQPDLGTASLLVLTWFGMLLFTGIKRSQVVALLLAALLLAVVAWQFLLLDYQKDRILGYVGFGSEQVDTYNVDQASIAIGSGGWFGKGIGYGSQSQLNFLPEKHTDFIFAVVAEELGFVGAVVSMGLFMYIVVRMVLTASQVKDSFGMLLAVGAAIMLAVQFFMNVAINVGLLPVTGISLPLVSYGGSGLLTSFITIGLVLSTARIQGGKVNPTASTSQEFFAS